MSELTTALISVGVVAAGIMWVINNGGLESVASTLWEKIWSGS